MTSVPWLVLGSHIPAGGRLGGMIRYTVEVIRALAARSDVDVHVHCQLTSVPFLVDEIGLERSRLHPSATGRTMVDSLAEQYGLARLMASIQPGVVVGTKQLLPIRGTRAFRVLTIHDMLPFDRPEDFGLLKRSLLPSAYLRSIHNADLLVCVSHASKQRLLTLVPEVAPRVTVIANAMTSALGSARDEPLAGLTPRSFALVVGDRSPRKNVGLIVDLWPQVVSRCPYARLLLVGPPGWGRDETVPGLAGMTRNGSVVEAGMVSDGQLKWAYQNASVTLCPSRLEGFGLPVVEALNFGCPVVLSTDPAQVEAARGRGSPVDLDDRKGWIDAIVDHFETSRMPPAAETDWTWDDMTDELVRAVGLRAETWPGDRREPTGVD